jgi:hypothetical protein
MPIFDGWRLVGMRGDSKEGVVILVVVVPERGPPYRVRCSEEIFA